MWVSHVGIPFASSSTPPPNSCRVCAVCVRELEEEEEEEEGGREGDREGGLAGCAQRSDP